MKGAGARSNVHRQLCAVLSLAALIFPRAGSSSMLPKKEAAEHALYCSFAASLSFPVHVLGQPLWLLALSSLRSLGGQLTPGGLCTPLPHSSLKQGWLIVLLLGMGMVTEGAAAGNYKCASTAIGYQPDARSECSTPLQLLSCLSHFCRSSPSILDHCNISH